MSDADAPMRLKRGPNPWRRLVRAVVDSTPGNPWVWPWISTAALTAAVAAVTVAGWPWGWDAIILPIMLALAWWLFVWTEFAAAIKERGPAGAAFAAAHEGWAFERERAVEALPGAPVGRDVLWGVWRRRDAIVARVEDDAAVRWVAAVRADAPPGAAVPSGPRGVDTDGFTVATGDGWVTISTPSRAHGRSPERMLDKATSIANVVASDS